jgi:hypothetical protein
VKNKILLILLAMVFVLGLGLVACTGEEEEQGPTPSDTIVLGASVSDTGVLADIHHLAKMPVVNEWIATNPTMTVGGTAYPVEKDYIDDASLLSNCLDNTDTIIDRIHAGTDHILLGPTCTAFLEAQAIKATNAHVVQMTMEGGATSLIPNLSMYKYSFINLNFANWFEIPVLAKMLATAPNWTAADHAYIGYQNDDHGLEYSSQAFKYFTKEGITIDNMMPMTSGDTGADAALVNAAKAANSSILCAFAYPEFVFGLAAVCQAQNYTPKAMIIGPGGNFGVYGFDSIIAGNESDGVMCFATANNKTPGAAGALISQLEHDLGMPNTDYWGHPLYWAALQMVQTSIVAVGNSTAAGFTLDQDALCTYLKTHKFTTDLGQTWYVTPAYGLNTTQYYWPDSALQWPVPAGSGCLLNYKCHTGEIGQWQNGYIEIVGYPGIGGGGDEYNLTKYYVTATFQYPKPAWK